MNVNTMKQNFFSTKYRVAVSLLLDVSALQSCTHKSLGGSQLARGWGGSRGRCTTAAAAAAAAAKAGDDDLN